MMIEEDEVESMRSGKDVDALQATLNRDIDGKNHSPSQLFATGNTGIGDANTNLHRHHAPKLLQICELFSVLRALVDGNRKRQLLILYDKYKKNEIPIEGFFRQVKDVAGRPTVELAISKLQQLRQGKMGIRAPGRPSHNRVSFTSAEISAQKSDPRGVHVNQLPSTSPGTLSTSATVQGLNKYPQQHIQLPSSSGTLSSSATSVGGLTKSTINRTTVPMFERPTSVNGPSRVQDAISHFQNNSSLPLDSPYSQGSVTKDQTVGPLPSVVHVKRESIDQSFDQAQKPCSSVPQGVSNVPMKQNHGNSRKSNDDLEKQSSKMVFSTSTTHASFVSPSMTTHLDSSTMVNLPGPSGTTLAGANVATTPKMPSVGHKNPRETLGSPLPPSRKKQKVCSTSSHRSISQLNDVTADSGINLEEEEEQLLSSIPKKDGHVSKASRRVVHEEEERTFLQKIPLQRKLTEIMAKSSIKHMNDDVKRCLSVCVEERMRGLLSNIIRLSKHRTDAEKCRNQTFVTSDIRKQINEMNQKMKEEWERNHSEEKELKNAENDTEKEDCSKQVKANKEEKDKLRAKAANVAARAAVGGDDMFLKWKLMAEAHQKPSSGLVKNSKKPYAETGGRRFGKKQGSPKVVRSISVNDVIAVVEKEPQMSKSTLLYRLYNRICAEDVRTQEKKT